MSRSVLSDLTRPIAHIIHIGAGMARDLPAYLEASPVAVTLIEADPEIATQLSTAVADHPCVTVIEAAVSADLHKRAFRQTNFAELNSFRKPTGLTELFPGLRTLSREVVKPTDPVRLIRDLDLSPEGSNLLVIEAPGEALGILKALNAADLLLGFDAIRLQEGCEVLYHQAPTAQDIRSFLAEAGYWVEFETSPDDPERPYLNARVDRKTLEAARQIKHLQQQVEDQRASLTERDGLVESLTGERDSLLNKIAQATEARETAEWRLTQIREEMFKAEGQVELIRNILLHGPSL